MNYSDKNNIPRHSFLFWLVIPIIVVWLALNYVRAESDESYLIAPRNVSYIESEISVFTREYPDPPENVNGYVTLWFDDAWLSQYLTAAPVLREFEFPGTIAVPTKAVETPGYVNWAQIQTLQQEGWEVTNHSQTHDCGMHTWTLPEIRNEFIKSSIDLWANGLTSDIFVAPCGVDSPTLRKAAQSHFLAFRGVEPGINDTNSLDPTRLPVKNVSMNTTFEELVEQLDVARNTRSWLIIVFHKVGEEEPSTEDETYNIELDTFYRVMQAIVDREISVVTPSQLLKNL